VGPFYAKLNALSYSEIKFLKFYPKSSIFADFVQIFTVFEGFMGKLCGNLYIKVIWSLQNTLYSLAG